MFAAGLAGIEEELELPGPVEDRNLFEDAQRGVKVPGLAKLPLTLGEAIERFASSELMKRTLGDHIHSFLVREKTAEWHEYLQTVSQWEYDRYLAVL
jgi:glutamine synthetase